NNNKTISGSKEETDPTSESINKVEGKQNSEKSDSRESMPSDDSESIKDSKENSSVKVSNYKEFKDALLNKNIRTIYLDKDI
ncbi:pectate lyase-like adhesive domain-containing protein, partial [Escherichia coli]